MLGRKCFESPSKTRSDWLVCFVVVSADMLNKVKYLNTFRIRTQINTKDFTTGFGHYRASESTINKFFWFLVVNKT